MTTKAQSLPQSASGPYNFVISSLDGPVGIVTLDKPKQLNAVAQPLLVELVEAIEQHDANPLIRVMVITGGPSVFAADLGLMPGGGGTQRLTRAVGKFVAMDMVLSGRMLNVDEALAHGLAARAVPSDSLLTEAAAHF